MRHGLLLRTQMLLAIFFSPLACNGGDEGNPTEADASSVPPGARTVSVVAGSDFACALLDSGRVLCWGQGDKGQLGDGAAGHESCQQECSKLPVAVAGLTSATAAEAGQSHACAVLKDSTVVCWGDNQYGACGGAAPASAVRAPIAVQGLSGVTDLALEEWNSCALLSDGTVSCWGRDYSAGPAQIQGLVDAKQIDSGREHTCAVRSDGTVVCWGDNFMGMSNAKLPTAVQGLADIVQLACGERTCLARSALGAVYCWGRNSAGQCGIGQSSAEEILVPVSVPGLSSVSSIAFGGDAGAAVLADGTVVHWGDRNGDKGLGDTLSPGPVPDSAGTSAVAIGWGFAVYLLRQDGSIAAWGSNGDGELGDGTTKDAFGSPTKVGVQ